MRDEIERFVAALRIPEDRKAVVLAELLDHVACVEETARREGGDPAAAARAAIDGLAAQRASYEAIEPAFRITRARSLARGVLASLVIAVALDQGGPLMHGLVGALLALAVAALCSPPRLVELLRAELRAPRVNGMVSRGIPIGAAVTYLFTVMSAPFLVWIGMLVVRAFAGNTHVDAPFSAFSVCVVGYGMLLVEGVRARRRAVA